MTAHMTYDSARGDTTLTACLFFHFRRFGQTTYVGRRTLVDIFSARIRELVDVLRVGAAIQLH